jgi:tRNA(Ile)-lysidine synthase
VFNAFVEHIHHKNLFTPKNKLLLAISGGIDSVVLAHLLHKAGFNFSMAHCNFNLRGKDSLSDEKFCRNLAKKLQVPFYSQTFDVKAYCKKNKVSVQMAARELRYDWFIELLNKEKIKYLLTAHHANDVIETVFINLLRGTGINGLKGISEKADRIVRPLLNFSKTEIEEFATLHKLKYRLDKSNLEPKYERNFLRLNIIPALKKTNPAFEKIMLSNVAHFKEEAEMLNDFLLEKFRRYVITKDEFAYIDKLSLKHEKYLPSVLHFILSPFGFNASQLNDIKESIIKNGQVGKVILSPVVTLTIDRTHLVIKDKKENAFEPLTIQSLADFKTIDYLLELKKISTFILPNSKELVVEGDKLVFPLTVRKRTTGDKFKPFGMNKFKLLSDFLKDQKLNKFEKDNCKVLVNGNNEIIWVMGYRSDNRYKVETHATNLIKLTLLE